MWSLRGFFVFFDAIDWSVQFKVFTTSSDASQIYIYRKNFYAFIIIFLFIRSYI